MNIGISSIRSITGNSDSYSIFVNLLYRILVIALIQNVTLHYITHCKCKKSHVKENQLLI